MKSLVHEEYNGTLIDVVRRQNFFVERREKKSREKPLQRLSGARALFAKAAVAAQWA